MEKTRFHAALALALGFSASAAFAADLSDDVPQPPQAVEQVVIENWPGFYAGVHAGGGWGDTTDRSTRNGDPAQPLGTLRMGTSGFLGGVQVGYNWQNDALVGGIEADLGYLGLRGSGEYGSARPDNLVRLQTDGGPYATLRGRLGVASDRFLIFATGGLFAADFNSSLTNPTGTITTGETGWNLGWTAGVGAEMIVTEKLRLKLDYLHFDAGSERLKSGRIGSITAIPSFVEHEIEHKGNLVRIGLNYRF